MNSYIDIQDIESHGPSTKPELISHIDMERERLGWAWAELDQWLITHYGSNRLSSYTPEQLQLMLDDLPLAIAA